jgi:anti-sigma-K factor RskA
MTDEMSHDEMRELVALHALGVVPADQCAAVAAHVADCPDCRAEYDNARLAAFGLAASASEPPPAGLRDKILSTITAKVTPMKSSDAPRSSLWRQPVWMAVAAAAVAIVFYTAWHASIREQAQNEPVSTQAVWTATCIEKPCQVSGQVVGLAPRVLRLDAHGLRPLPYDQTYQAWYIPLDGKPVPAPTFYPNSSGDATVTIPTGAAKGLVIAVTIEPEGGSKQPTSKPFLVANVD